MSITQGKTGPGGKWGGKGRVQVQCWGAKAALSWQHPRIPQQDWHLLSGELFIFKELLKMAYYSRYFIKKIMIVWVAREIPYSTHSSKNKKFNLIYLWFGKNLSCIFHSQAYLN